jgi:hypothetical protein
VTRSIWTANISVSKLKEPDWIEDIAADPAALMAVIKHS